jgi:hypothetical protein
MVEVVNSNNTGVAKASHSRCFPLETSDEVFVLCQMTVEHLNGHIAVKERLISFVDRGCSPMAQSGQDAIFA